jgi:AMP-polyphosphate phosphotransferase
MNSSVVPRRPVQGRPHGFAQVSVSSAVDTAPSGSIHGAMGRLDDLDLTKKLKRDEEDERLQAGGRRLAQLRLALGGKLEPGSPFGPPLVLVFEGWDASGKGGAINRLVAPLDARHVRVAAYAAPTADEKRHHYLKRFWPALPGRGGMTVFDRSWYGRVLVERVEGFAHEDEWKRAYGEIAEFEKLLVADGAIVAKFWLHVSPEEQLHRFERRQEDPLKRWKITDEDWRNREKRPEYEAAVEEMLERTDLPEAPWILVEGESKRFARVKVMESVIEQVERGCAARGFELPPPLQSES